MINDTLSEPWTWCTNCQHHNAHGPLCPVCLDDQTHGATITTTPQPQDDRGTN